MDSLAAVACPQYVATTSHGPQSDFEHLARVSAEYLVSVVIELHVVLVHPRFADVSSSLYSYVL